MAATKNLADYATFASITATGLASLASSTTLVAGWSLAEIDNTTNKYLDEWITAKFTVGTTPTANTSIEIWAVGKKNATTYHEGFDGTSKAVTVTREMLQAYGRLVAGITIASTTSNIGYELAGSVADACRAVVMPSKYQLFVVHNTGVAANATGGNFVFDREGRGTSSGN